MHKIYGWTDEVTACDCCGKSDLSGTFCVELEDGAQLHYGSTCVKRNTGIKNPKTAASQFENERSAAARKEYIESPEWRAYFARQEAGHKAGIVPGKAFKEYMHDVAEADAALKRSLAEKYRIPTYRV